MANSNLEVLPSEAQDMAKKVCDHIQILDSIMDLMKNCDKFDADNVVKMQFIASCYLYVASSVFVETSVQLILGEYARENFLKRDPAQLNSPVISFVDDRLGSYTNLNSDKISKLLKAFSSDWSKNFGDNRLQEYKDSVDCIRDIRNKVAHSGENTSGYLTAKKSYYNSIHLLVEVCKITR